MRPKTYERRDIKGFYIDGGLRAPDGSTRLDVISPRDEEVVGSVPVALPSDIDAAVAAARRALDDGSWGRSDAAERAAIVRRLGAELENRQDEIVDLVAAEAGMPITVGRLTQVNSLPGYYAGLAATFPWEEKRAGLISDGLVRAEPVGVIGLITPWNSPMGILLQELAPALVAGNTVVVKPPDNTPLHAYVLAQALDAAGVPPGVVNLVPGDAGVGAHLVQHPDIDMVSFTGSAATGRRIMALAAEQLTRVHLELGGKSAAILLDDASLEQAIGTSLAATCVNAGQACTALSRILAPRERLAEVLDIVVDSIGRLSFGDPFEEGVVVGPLISGAQRDRVEQAISGAVAEGARVLTGRRQENPDRGFWVTPTVLADVTNQMRIAQEETFGPVVSVIAYDGVEQAVEIANDSPYGLSGAVWTADPERGTEIARRVRTGTISVNGAVADQGLPFGGFKQSGLGRKWGYEGLAEYTELQVINLPATV